MERHTNHLEIKNYETRRSEISGSEEPGNNPLFLENQKTEVITMADNKVKVYGNQDEIGEQDKNVKKQTVAGATFIFAKTSIGLTILTFGVRASQFGMVWFLVFSAICAVINIWSEIRLVQSVDNIKEREYSKVVEKLLGKVWAKILNVFIFLYCLLAVMSYISLMYSLIGRFIHAIWYYDKYELFDDYNKAVWNKYQYKCPIIFGYSIILLFISLKRNMVGLNFAGYSGIIAVTYSVLVVICQCHKYYNWYHDNERIPGDKSTYPNYWDFSKAFTKKLEFFKGMAALFAAYVQHSNVFPVYVGFGDDEEGKSKVIKASYYGNIFVAIYHSLIIVCAFLTEPLNPEDLIIYRVNRFGGRDVWMSIAKLCCSFCIFFSTPLLYFGLRSTVISTISDGELTTKNNLIITISVYLFSATIGIVYDNILNYITYLGGFTSIVFSFLYPIILYIVANGKGWFYWKNLLELSIATILSLIGYIAGILTIIDDVKGD
jgi:amino acid permease